MPADVWVTCFVISVLEASAIVLSAVLIKLHVGRRSHADMGDALLVSSLSPTHRCARKLRRFPRNSLSGVAP